MMIIPRYCKRTLPLMLCVSLAVKKKRAELSSNGRSPTVEIQHTQEVVFLWIA